MFNTGNPPKHIIGRALKLTDKIFKEAQKNGVPMSKRKAKKIAFEHFGYVDSEHVDDSLKNDMSFKSAQKSVDPKYSDK